MAGEFKGLPIENQDAQLAERADLMADSYGLFEEFDPETQGGLRVTPTGQVYEVRHPKWAEENATLAERSSPLPLFVQPDGSIEHRVPEFDPKRATRGSEFEIAVMREDTGEWWDVSPDGETLVYPDGSTDTLRQHNFDPEALKCMIEFQTDIARSAEEHRRNIVAAVYATELWMEEHGLQSPYLSVHPEDFGEEAINQLPYIVRTTNSMANMREFGTMSAQLTIQDKDHEAAQHVVNKYQEKEAVVGAVTASAPIRDGRFETTIGEHYTKRPEGEGGPYDQPALPEEDFAWLNPNAILYDHREAARSIGSQSGGALKRPGKLQLVEHLIEGDKKLRDGTNIVLARTLGWHTERDRVEKGATEYCNIALAGGNLYKLPAAQELVGAQHLGGQIAYTESSASERAQAAGQYEADAAIGHINNIMAGLHGKQALLGVQESAQTLTEALDELIAEANQHAPEPISEIAQAELRATLSPDMPAYHSVDETFAAFFQPNSPMTATDALRYAHKLEPEMPLNILLLKFAGHRRQHVYEVAAQYGLRPRTNMLGNLAIAR